MKRGEVVGIPGRNGAGKSTLLQAICGTITPTSGTVEVNGRARGTARTGFGLQSRFHRPRECPGQRHHHGRMSQAEVGAKRYDAIVAFAELAEFMDQPVKTYSGGMHVRLAFAVAIHYGPRNPHRRRSPGGRRSSRSAINAWKRSVSWWRSRSPSYSSPTTSVHCNFWPRSRVVWLDHGTVKADRRTDPCIPQDYYAELLGQKRETVRRKQAPMPMQQDTGKAVFTDVRLLQGGEDGVRSPGQEPSVFTFAVKAKEDFGPIVFNISIYRSDGDWVVGQTSREAGRLLARGARGRGRKGSKIDLSPVSLAPRRLYGGHGRVLGRLYLMLCLLTDPVACASSVTRYVIRRGESSSTPAAGFWSKAQVNTSDDAYVSNHAAHTDPRTFCPVCGDADIFSFCDLLRPSLHAGLRRHAHGEHAWPSADAGAAQGLLRPARMVRGRREGRRYQLRRRRPVGAAG